MKLMARAVEGIEMKDLKSLADDGKKQIGSGVVAIVGVTGDGKAGVVVGVTTDLTSRYNAVDLARVASVVLGGKGGGGRPDMAQAGGPDGAKADAALSAIEKAMAGAVINPMRMRLRASRSPAHTVGAAGALAPCSHHRGARVRDEARLILRDACWRKLLRTRG